MQKRNSSHWAWPSAFLLASAFLYLPQALFRRMLPVQKFPPVSSMS